MSKRPGDPGYAAGWCIHFRSLGSHTTCEVGVPYSNFASSMRPCFLDDKTGESKPDALHCDKLRRPTKEEIDLHEQWLKERMNKQILVMVGIEDWRKSHKGKSVSEVVECPACKGRLHLSIAASNGHVHGSCETQDCVSWME
jgi:hypothetical protein